MSKLYNGGASFGFSLNYNTAVPVDTRSAVQAKSDLLDPKTWVSGTYDEEIDSNNVYVVYPGLTVSVVDEGTAYIFKAEEVNGATIASEASWSKLATGGNTETVQGDVNAVKAGVGLDKSGNHIATSGNYTGEATTIAGEISALDTELKKTNDLLGTAADGKDAETAFGKIAKETADRIATIESLDADESAKGSNVTVGVKEVDGVITEVTVAEDYATVTKGDKTITIASGDEGKLIKASDLANAAAYAKELVDQEVSDRESAISGLKVDSTTIQATDAAEGPNVSVTYSEANGIVNIGSVTIRDIASAAKLSGEIAKIAASKTLDENYELTAEIKYVPATEAVNAHLALVDEAGTELSTVPVSDIIGNAILDHSEYNKETGILHLFFPNGDGTLSDQEVNLSALLDINDVLIAEGSKDYLGVSLDGSENNQAVFSVKIQSIATASETNKGLADAADVKAYVDSKSAAATTSIEEKNTGHVTVSKSTEADGSTKYTVAENDIASAALLGTASDDSSKATAFGKIAKEVEDRNQAITEAIQGLDKTATATTGTNVKVTVSETDGIVSVDKVEETYATVTRTEGKVNPSLTVTTPTGLVKGSDIEKVKGYADDIVSKEADARNEAITNTINSLAGEKTGGSGTIATVKVSTSKGEVSAVEVTTNPATVGDDLSVTSETGAVVGSDVAKIKSYTDNSISGLNADVTGGATGNVSVKVVETAGKVSSVTVTEKHATVSRVEKAEGVSESLSVTNVNQLATGSDIEKVAGYAEDIVSSEAERVDNKIASLGGSVTSDDATYTTVKVDTEAGEVKDVVVTEKVQAVATSGSSAKGLAEASDVKSYVDSKTSDLAISAEGDSYVEAAVDPTNNKKINVSTNTGTLTVGADGSLSGTDTLATGSDVAAKVSTFTEGKISKAIDALDKAETTASASGAKVTVKYSETDGIVSISTTESDIASAALLGTTGDTSSASTAFGKIKKEEESRKFEAGSNTSSAVLRGTGTSANNAGEVAVGKNNISSTGTDSSAKTLFSVGNGASSSSKSNAMEVRENGDVWFNLGGNYQLLQSILSNEIDWYEGD